MMARLCKTLIFITGGGGGGGGGGGIFLICKYTIILTKFFSVNKFGD